MQHVQKASSRKGKAALISRAVLCVHSCYCICMRKQESLVERLQVLISLGKWKEAFQKNFTFLAHSAGHLAFTFVLLQLQDVSSL